MSEADAGQVVFYRTDDHAGTLRRLCIDAIDSFVAIFVSLALSAIAVAVLSGRTAAAWIAVSLIWWAVWVLYFVVWKGSRFRTLGYLLCGANIVDFRGERPGYLALAGRFGFVLLGPFNFVVDLLWIASDPSRQALRDKVAHTYVVRKKALPAGPGRIVYRVYMLFGMTLLFAEVDPVAALLVRDEW